MRSVPLIAHRTMEVREVPQPRDPAPGQVTVKITAVGICGSDLHWYQDGRVGHIQTPYPRLLGHEPAREIADFGAGVTDLNIGQRVAIEPAITCGLCEYCRTNFHNHCDSLVFHGSITAEGFFQDYLNVPAKNCLPVHDSLSLAQITFIEPLTIFGARQSM